MPRKAKDEKLNNIEKDTIKNAKKLKTVKTSKQTDEANKSTPSSKTKTQKKSASSKKPVTTSKSKTQKKTNTVKKSTKKLVSPAEYYDLPATYNKTVVKILAQTPSCLFVYWEISEKDKTNLLEQYGENFFQDTKPYLLIFNETMNYSFEVEINDYANSWYIRINDSDCKYYIKLIRKPLNNSVSIAEPFINISSSNEIESPNDHILFDKLGKTVFFKNVKTNIINEKSVSSISLLNNIGKIYNIYDFYKDIYKDELDGNELTTGLSSSQFSSFS